MGHKRLTISLRVPVIGILRGVDGTFFDVIMRASFAAGLEALEVTMNTERAEEIVARNRPNVPDGKLLGMGTIRNLYEARRAVSAGAMFLVTPNLDPAVIEYGVAAGIPVVAGALTPTEVYKAWLAGAAMVKVFPCGAMGGPRYIRDLRGPFDGIPLAAVGGVSLENIGEYFAAGAAAVGVGPVLFGREALAERNGEAVGRNVRRFIEHCPGGQDEVY